VKFDVHMAVQHEKFRIIEPTRYTNFSNFFYFVMKLCMLRTFPPSIIRSFSLYTQQRYMSYRFADRLRAGANAPAQQTCMTYTVAVCTVKNS